MFDCDEAATEESTVLQHAESTACSEVEGLEGRAPQDAACDRWQLSGCSIFGYVLIFDGLGH